MDITPETVAEAVNKVATARGKGTVPNIMAFGRALKHLGVKVSLSQLLDAARSADLVDIAERGDFRALLRANLISQKEDFPVFDMLFDCFWREQSYERVPMETMDIQGTPRKKGSFSCLKAFPNSERKRGDHLLRVRLACRRRQNGFS